jgi:inosose dehydratase
VIRLGINPLTWSNDDLPELGGDTPLETCLAEAREAGFAGVELGHKFPRDPTLLREVLDQHGLALASGWYGARLLSRSVEEELEALAPHADLLAACGAKAVVFAEVTGAVHGERATPLSARPRLVDDGWRRLGDALTRVGDALEARGLRLAYHPHMGTVVESEADVEALLAASGPSVGLLLDTGHLTYAGGDVVSLARRHATRVAHVHLKDVRAAVLEEARVADRPFLDAVVRGVFTVPGDGTVDYPAVLAILAEARYQGWLVVEAEQDPAVAHPLTYARMGYSYTARETRAAGLA